MRMQWDLRAKLPRFQKESVYPQTPLGQVAVVDDFFRNELGRLFDIVGPSLKKDNHKIGALDAELFGLSLANEPRSLARPDGTESQSQSSA